MSQTEVLHVEEAVKSKLQPGNKKTRIMAFDFARGIAIIAMVTIHAIVFLGDPDLIESFWSYVANSIICLLAAPIFTFIMGIMIGLSSKSSSKELIYRGLTILALGYLLNVLRGTIPISVAEWFEWMDPKGENPWAYILEVDILQFAGIAFLVVALMKRLISWNTGLLVAGVIVMFVSPLLWEITFTNPVVNYFSSLFFGGNEYNFFPVFPWLGFVLIGIFYSTLLKTYKDNKLFFTVGLYVGIIILVIGIIALFFDNSDILVRWYEGEFRQGQLPPLVSVIFLGFISMWLSVCYFITEKIKENWLTKKIYFWSRNVTWFYVIQWVLIGWLCVMLPELSWLWLIIVIVGVHFVTDKLVSYFCNMEK